MGKISDKSQEFSNYLNAMDKILEELQETGSGHDFESCLFDLNELTKKYH